MITTLPIKQIIFALLFISCTVLSAQESATTDTLEKAIKTPIALPDFDTSTTIFQKIMQDSFFEVVLKTNFDTLIKNKKISRKKYAGTILFKNASGETFKTKVKIEPRGRSRRKYCNSMPPLKIDFPKKALDNLGLYPGADKLKLVTNCNDNETSDQVLMKEYWIYKLYNEITPESFQVFPVKITYVDTDNPDDKIIRHAFFIESNEELSLRLNGELVSLFGTRPDMIKTNSYHNTLLFQYMIGNLDWDITVGRNVKLLKTPNSEKYTLVPYDFDFSGLVKAPHARLNPDYGQKNIEERFPQGKFASKEALHTTIDQFNSHKKAGFNCFNQCSTLSKGEKKKMHRYLGSFYKLLRDKPYLEELFLE
ncbi:MAG: hypothetical protein AAGJ18_19240 [Bacteroidota bacterium]